MATKGLTARELARIGIPRGEATRLAGLGIRAALEAGVERAEIRRPRRARQARGDGATSSAVKRTKTPCV